MKRALFLIAIGVCCLCGDVLAAEGCCANAQKVPADCNSVTGETQTDELTEIFENIRKATEALKSCEADIAYLFIQDPDLIDSQTLRTGKLYYQKAERSQLRIRFETLQQDDFEPEKRVEDYYFDGVWFTKVDYKLQQIDLYQQAPEDKPVGVFELINQQFPLIGFTGVENLKKDFEISLVKNASKDPKTPIQLLLTVKKDSKFSDEYKKIDFWIDSSTFLPTRIKAYKTQDDINDIRFSGTKTNKNLKKAVFTIETPAHFRKNIEPLKQEPKTKGK